MSVFFRKRRVRVHFLPQMREMPDFEGLLAGRTDGRYLMLAPRMLESGDATYSLDNAIEIERETVWFMERL